MRFKVAKRLEELEKYYAANVDAPEFKLCHMASTPIYLIMHLAPL